MTNRENPVVTAMTPKSDAEPNEALQTGTAIIGTKDVVICHEVQPTPSPADEFPYQRVLLIFWGAIDSDPAIETILVCSGMWLWHNIALGRNSDCHVLLRVHRNVFCVSNLSA